MISELEHHLIYTPEEFQDKFGIDPYYSKRKFLFFSEKCLNLERIWDKIKPKFEEEIERFIQNTPKAKQHLKLNNLSIYKRDVNIREVQRPLLGFDSYIKITVVDTYTPLVKPDYSLHINNKIYNPVMKPTKAEIRLKKLNQILND